MLVQPTLAITRTMGNKMVGKNNPLITLSKSNKQ